MIFPYIKIHFPLFLSIILFTSCDILTAIQFDNRTGKNVSIRYFMIENPDNIFLSEIYLPKSSEIPLALRRILTEKERNEYIKITQKNQNIHSIPTGLNELWTEKKIRKYINNIQKIEIITSSEVIILEKDELFQYLKKHRNFWRNKIIIKIKE
jgi:hypothetical protein